MSSLTSPASQSRVTVSWVRKRKGKGKITALTAYDYPTARVLDDAGIDVLLVGDSVGTVIYGESSTLSVTVDDIVRHTRAVSRAVNRALVVADMPFLSYQVTIAQAITNAGRLLKESGAHAVKLEGGVEMVETISALTRIGIPVMAHIGLQPQSIHLEGVYRTRGKIEDEQRGLIQASKAVAEAGAFAVVLECVEEKLAKEITQSIEIPTIGIGSGEDTDGQILVTHDLIGLTVGHVPQFVNPLGRVGDLIREMAKAYVQRTVHPRPKSISTKKRGDGPEVSH